MRENRRKQVKSQIVEHVTPEKNVSPVRGDQELFDAVTEHLHRNFGDQEITVLHEAVGHLVHIDLHVVPPSDDRRYYIVATSGMAQRPMRTPAEAQDFRYAELCMCLPPHWQLTDEYRNDAEWFWPIYWLKYLARLPHEFNTWLGEYHTIPNGDPPEPLGPTTSLCCNMIVRPTLLPESFHRLHVSPERTVHYYNVVPLYEDETDLKLRKGGAILLDRLIDRGITDMIVPNRPNVALKRVFHLH